VEAPCECLPPDARARMNRSVGLAPVLASVLPSWIGWTGSQALLGWLVFSATSSAALVSLAFTLRLAALALSGVPVGALSDRAGRIPVLVGSNAAAAGISLILALAASMDSPPLWMLLLASAGYGLADSARLVSGANLVFDRSGDFGATRALAIGNSIAAFGQVLGGVIAGFTLSNLGSSATAAFVGLAFASSCISFASLRAGPSVRSKEARTLRSDVRDGLRLMRQVSSVRVLMSVAVLVEVFAFSGMALDPVFAGSVFEVGAAGLGAILAARAMGRLAGAVVLALLPRRAAIGSWLAISVSVFGAGLVGYAFAPELPAALGLVWLTGFAAVLVDTLVQTSLQAGVREAARGRAAGLWVLTFGLGPVGVLEIGYAAQFFGARSAQALNGFVVLIFGLLLLGTIGRRVRSIATAGLHVDKLMRENDEVEGREGYEEKSR
jgi:MFS family permease